MHYVIMQDSINTMFTQENDQNVLLVYLIQTNVSSQ